MCREDEIRKENKIISTCPRKNKFELIVFGRYLDITVSIKMRNVSVIILYDTLVGKINIIDRDWCAV
jgi:hypothetical protein